MFFMSLWKEFQLLQILNVVSIKHLIKLILYEYDLKLLKFKRSPVQLVLWYVWSVRLLFDYPYLELIHEIAFLDVFISGINNQNPILQTCDKWTFTALFLNFKSFTSFLYKISLIKCLTDRTFNLHSTTTCFDSYNCLSFKIIDKTNSKVDLKTIEALHINWTKPKLILRQNHLALPLSL